MTAVATRSGTDRGSVTAFFAAAVLALLVMAGLVVDGGGKVRALQRADRIAAEAGRAAGQQIDLAAAVAGERPRVEVPRAVAAARRYLAATGTDGTVAIAPDRRSLTIEVRSTSRTVFLGLVGIGQLSATGTATVELVPGVRTERP